MRTGVTAFKLSMGKALVPFMFVYAPCILFINFTWGDFSLAMLSGILSILSFSVAGIGYFKNPVNVWEKVILVIGGLLLVSNDIKLILIGTVLSLSILALNFLTKAKQ